ncbi:hypothetical protein WJX73_007847 [Symbiochloris irregularis]|uniref:Urea transporter n=1 Tax=Symbiochloris irregularis TaxID=706552 RepID=A0AAW1NWH3_9CHLO
MPTKLVEWAYPWACFTYAYQAGWVGLMVYSLSSGLPVLLIAFLGTFIRNKIPNIMSFSDYVLRRFGWPVQLWVSALMLLNMGISITAEYTAMGDYFAIILGSTRVPIVIVVGVLSSIYTAYGGLYVSIVTDQIQAVLSVVLILVMCIFVAVTFRKELPSPLPSNLSGDNYYGFASIAVLPISLASASVYSEALWQRCWAGASNRKLLIGASLASFFIIIAVFIFGFLGFLAIWSGLWTYDYEDPSTQSVILFDVLNVDGQKIWLLTLVGCLAVTMSTSLIDSYQNGIVDNISGVYLRGQNVLWTRALVLILNVPCIVTSLQGYNILNLFLLANLITTTSTLPVLAGLIKHPWAHRIVTPATMLFGCWLSFASLCIWSKAKAADWHLTTAQAIHKTFFENYDWPPFVLALGISVLGMAIMAVVENIFRTSLCKRFPRLAYSDERVKKLHEAHPLPVHLDLGVKEKLAHLDVPGKPAKLAPEDEIDLPHSPKLDQ